MATNRYLPKIYRALLTLVLGAGATQAAVAQSDYQPYSFQFYQKLNTSLYSTQSNQHTALKPLVPSDGTIGRYYDSLMRTSAYRSSGRLLTDHLVSVHNTNATFFADVLPNFSIGRDFSGHTTTHQAAVGLQLGGSLGGKFFYYISGDIDASVYPDYMTTYINQVGIVPGRGRAHQNITNGYSWYNENISVLYKPVKYLTIEAGKGKTFIGDGYRSLLLSDYASPYPFFKLTGTLGNVTYMAMWADMDDPATTSQYGVNRRKFSVFHYLDWNVNKRLSLGFFENIMGYFTDDNGTKRPFDWNYINPVILMQPTNNGSDDPDKSLLGLDAKYKISDYLTVYGQFALNEFRASEFFSSNGNYQNKYGWQLGLRGSNLFAVQNLNFLIETNNVKPYTYSARSAIENYSEMGEPLAHPWGANFREAVGILNYSYKHFDFSGELDLGRYGLDENGLNYGKNIFKVYTSPARINGNYTGQGLTTNMEYLEGKVAYVINPRYNLRFELGGILRREKNDAFNDKTSMLTIGLKSAFSQVYNDIASFKAH